MALAVAHTGFSNENDKLNPYIGFYSRIKEQEQQNIRDNMENKVRSRSSTVSNSQFNKTSTQLQSREETPVRRKVELSQDQLYNILHSPI